MKKMLIMLLITIPALSACLDDGKNGKVGVAGAQGIQGETGAIGAQGIAGIAGATGPAGADGQDVSVCRMGVYIPGAYLLQAMDDGSFRHSALLIIDMGLVTTAKSHPTEVYGVVVRDTSSGLIVNVARRPDGTLEYPLVGSCFALPPAA
jgi:hypothetical protein